MKSNGCHAHEGSIHKGHQTHTACQLHGGEVIGGQGHDFTRRAALKEDPVKGQKVSEQAAAKIRFQSAGKTQEHIAPEKPQDGNEQGQNDDYSASRQQAIGSGRPKLEGINCALDDERDDELQEIHRHQGQKAHRDLPEMASEIGRNEANRTP